MLNPGLDRPEDVAAHASFRGAALSAPPLPRQATVAARVPPASRPSAQRQAEHRQIQARTLAHKLRCNALGPAPDDGEVARMVAEYHARGGRVTICPAAHALPVQNGAGREADRWVV